MMRKQSFSALLMAVVVICMLAACGNDSAGAFSETLSQSGTNSQNSEEFVDANQIQTTSAEETGDENENEWDTTTEPESTPVPEPQEIQITISAAGDVTLGNYYGQGYSGSFRETFANLQDYSYFFENVYDIFNNDDMTLVNLEGPLTRAEERQENQEFCISGDPEFVNILTAGSIEAVSMGNNHRLDYFQQGSDDTVNVLEKTGIAYAYDQYIGIYETPQGILIGFVSVSAIGKNATREKYLMDGIKSLREAGCDLVLACCHWGIERDYNPNDYQKELSHKCIDWGADLVIGHHPHVLQGIEEYQGKYIIYSLGNFCFGANKNPSDKDCLIIQQTFTFIDGIKQENTQLKVIPCSISSVSKRNDYKPTPAEGEEAIRILEKLNTYSQEFDLRFDSDGYPVK